ncbi:VOC family protein [Micromonospora sp. NBC_00362]|uniref:VOC family protein n=1 Tax=Micromonospora sp. NBC_00362 TaxID=2975975 RepID=UPI0022509DCD|nr:VOC family protein [Micromonospora sp. NBC_00362]MCX5115704.1 VOC family protein [Micromonospora sp. NBC_00362]
MARCTSSDPDVAVQLVSGDATAPEDSVISPRVDDVDGAYAEAQRLGQEIVHPLTTEPCGRRRFFVRDPDGNVVNVAAHRS